MTHRLSQTGPHWRQPAAIYAWLLVFAWLALILLLSSDAFSAPTTGSLLGPVLRWLFPDWSASEIWKLHFAIRKTGHVSVYGVLALLSFRAVRLSLAASTLRHAALALALVIVSAATDEYRQSLSRARTGSLADVGYDLAGGVAALALLVAAQRTRNGIRKRRARF
jgi:VanZ family protein